MVRPVARFRPAARRSVTTLQPVYFVTQAPTYIGSERIAEVFTGSEGKIAEFAPWTVAAAPQPSGADPGFVSSAKARIIEIWAGTTVDEVYITSSTYSSSLTNVVLRLFEHVVDGKFYSCFLRGAYQQGSYEVDYETVEGDLVLPRRFSYDNILISAAYDVVTTSVDLQSGSLVSSVASLYDSALIDVQVLTGGIQSTSATYRRVGTYVGLREAIGLSLPAGHPFKSCGASAWPFLSNLDNSFTGDYAYVTPFDVSPPSLIAFGSSVRGQNAPSPSFFDVLRQSTLARNNLFAMAGFNSASNQRVLRGGSASESPLELSSLNGAWDDCQGYGLLGSFVATSFADYAAGAVVDPGELLDVSAFSLSDQAGVLNVVPAPEAPPTGVVPAGSDAYQTADPIYFMGTTYRPSFAGNAISKYFSTHYWIAD